MVDKSSQIQHPYNYLSVNRGRYLCVDHGAFCDSSDNYLQKCLLCPDGGPHVPWRVNNVDRLLQVVNGLQNRSKRNVALLASLIGGIGLLRLVAELDGSSSGLVVHPAAKLSAYLAVIILLLSLAAYGASMAHIRTTEEKALKRNSLEQWEAHLAGELSKMEGWHIWAGRLFGLGAVLLAIALAVQTAAADDIRELLAGWLCSRGSQ